MSNNWFRRWDASPKANVHIVVMLHESPFEHRDVAGFYIPARVKFGDMVP